MKYVKILTVAVFALGAVWPGVAQNKKPNESQNPVVGVVNINPTINYNCGPTCAKNGSKHLTPRHRANPVPQQAQSQMQQQSAPPPSPAQEVCDQNTPIGQMSLKCAAMFATIQTSQVLAQTSQALALGYQQNAVTNRLTADYNEKHIALEDRGEKDAMEIADRGMTLQEGDSLAYRKYLGDSGKGAKLAGYGALFSGIGNAAAGAMSPWTAKLGATRVSESTSIDSSNKGVTNSADNQGITNTVSSKSDSKGGNVVGSGNSSNDLNQQQTATNTASSQSKSQANPKSTLVNAPTTTMNGAPVTVTTGPVTAGASTGPVTSTSGSTSGATAGANAGADANANNGGGKPPCGPGGN